MARKRRGMKAGKGRFVAPSGSKKRGVKTYSGRQMRAYFVTSGFSRKPRKSK
jgi:hypothetical protein